MLEVLMARTFRPLFLRTYFSVFLILMILITVYLLNHARHPIPEAYLGTEADPATFLTPLQWEQSVVYAALRNGMYFFSVPWEWGLFLVLLFTGAASRWQTMLENRVRPVLRLPLFVLLLQAASFLWFLPLRITGFSLAKYYGVSTQSAASWARDKAVTFGVNYLLMFAVAAVAFWIMSKGGRWWLKLWLLSVPFTLFMMYIQPVVIDPLYNDFSRLSNPALEQRILELAAKAEIPADRVFEVNMSEKTNSLNAYVNGIGGSLRIVLWDTTLKKMTEQEILLIMAHEMGHYDMHHLEWSAVGAIASSFVVFWLGSRVYLYSMKRWGGRWGVHRPTDAAALPLVLLIMSLFTFIASPVTNSVSRNAENAADRYAFELIGQTEGAVSMYQKLASSSLSEVNPPFLVELFTSTHPSIMERIIYAKQYDKSAKP
jgi:STE24 endopeptidase